MTGNKDNRWNKRNNTTLITERGYARQSNTRSMLSASKNQRENRYKTFSRDSIRYSDYEPVETYHDDWQIW